MHTNIPYKPHSSNINTRKEIQNTKNFGGGAENYQNYNNQCNQFNSTNKNYMEAFGDLDNFKQIDVPLENMEEIEFNGTLGGGSGNGTLGFNNTNTQSDNHIPIGALIKGKGGNNDRSGDVYNKTNNFVAPLKEGDVILRNSRSFKRSKQKSEINLNNNNDNSSKKTSNFNETEQFLNSKLISTKETPKLHDTHNTLRCSMEDLHNEIENMNNTSPKETAQDPFSEFESKNHEHDE